MNKYEKKTQQNRKPALQSAMLVGTIGLVLIAIAVIILGLSNSASLGFYQKIAVAIIILLLILRQVGRRLKRKSNSPAKPDERSRLDLH